MFACRMLYGNLNKNKKIPPNNPKKINELVQLIRVGNSIWLKRVKQAVKNLKGIDYCPIEIIKGLTDKGQFQYLTKLKGPQVGNYLYTAQFLSLR